MVNLMEMIPIKWTTRNKKYYEDKGYKYTKLGDEFFIYLKDLPENSQMRVHVICDCEDCTDKDVFTPYRNYNKIVYKNGLYRCKPCSFKENMRLRDEKSRRRLYDLYLMKCSEKGCTPLTSYDDFNGCDTYVKYICPIHGQTETLMSRISNEDAWCYKCGKMHMAEKCRLTPTQVKQKIENKNNNVLLNAEDYINSATKNLKVICGECHKLFITSLSSIENSDGRCFYCGCRVFGNMARTTKEQLINLATIDEQLTILNPDDYVDMYTELNFICSECGNVFSAKPYNYLKRGFCRCINCQQYSKGEDIIASVFDENGIIYIRQMRFDDCRDQKTLPYDFYVPEYNYLIEYNGMQHYKPVDYFGGWEAFKKVQRHDEIKIEYANNNNIDMLVISYTDFDNIKSILTKVFKINQNNF